MNQREKILAIVTGSVAVIFVVVIVIVKMFIAPARALDTRIVAVKSQIATADRTLAQKGNYYRKLNDVSSRCFAATPQIASELLRARLVALVGEAGLNEQAIQLTPQTGRRVPKVLQSVGWSVSVKGSLESVVRLLYSVEHQPRIHRIKDLILSPVPRSNFVALRFKCMTLIIDPPKGVKLTSPRPKGTFKKVVWPEPVRAGYQRATARDIFLPAINQQPSSAAPQQVKHAAPTPTTRIFGLPLWGGHSEVLVQRSDSASTHVYHVGDKLAGGRIIGVDYRPMPRPDDPSLISQSRVIIRIKQKIWAVELGDTLAQKHLVDPFKLPRAFANTNQNTQPENVDH